MSRCPAGFSKKSNANAEFSDLENDILTTLIPCLVASKELEECRRKVAREGTGACVTKAKIHQMCLATQKHNTKATFSHCLGNSVDDYCAKSDATIYRSKLNVYNNGNTNNNNHNDNDNTNSNNSNNNTTTNNNGSTNNTNSNDNNSSNNNDRPVMWGHLELEYTNCLQDRSLMGYVRYLQGYRCAHPMQAFVACSRKYNKASTKPS